MRTLLNPNQINLRELFSVKHILESRGFNVSKNGENEDLMIPKFHWTDKECDFLFDVFNSVKNRNEILNLIDKRIANPRFELVKTLLGTVGFQLDRKKYTTTYEWYIGELLVRKFSAFSYSYGVEINNIKRNSTSTESGDFDIISVLRNTNLIYIECKSGKFKNIEQKHILKCIERGLSIHCELSIMAIDDIIDEEELKWALNEIKHPLANVTYLNNIGIKDLEASKVYEWGNCYFITSKKNIEEQLRTVLRINEARKIFDGYTSEFCDESYNNLGYERKEIK
ncbi:MAG: hypothetical protein Q8T04_21400 [Bacteroidota bacterium]|nr:hypothetical protein [Bacteroidota bacterium]